METLKVKKTFMLVSTLCLLQLAIFASVSQACAVITCEPLDVAVDVGSIHFRGEKADFYILVSSLGTPINATLTAA
ncbi:MAG: hypothetical protein QXV09_05605, partial [Candidatus Bathyarchaeia archaeon]